jgi:class 3 adenylate cyclase
MPASEQGFILIADITGYTAFLHESELEHAQDSLRHLLDLLIEQTKLPLEISRLEGDSVISYALQGPFHQGQTFVEIMETTYLKFRQALELMILNTNCTCKACRNLPNLDLKFFVHYGTFVLEPLANYTELIGNDVNVIHRLTKNNITETTGITAYVLYTQAAVEALGIEDIASLMTPHEETYEHIGVVELFVEDMHPVWEARRSELRTVVEPEQVLAQETIIVPVPLVTMWDYVTKPEYKAILTNADSSKVENRNNGRIGVGSSYQCAHGDTISPQTIVDWQPFEQYTYRGVGPGNLETLTTIALTPRENETEMAMYVGKPQGGSWLMRSLTIPVMRLFIKYYGPKLMKEFQAQIEKDQANKTSESVEMVDSLPEMVSQAT